MLKNHFGQQRSESSAEPGDGQRGLVSATVSLLHAPRLGIYNGDLLWQYVYIYIYTHRIHGAGIYANIGGILMVNVTIYSIHGSYGYIICNPGLMCFSFETSQNLTFENLEIEVCGSTSPLTYWWQKDANPRATFKVQADGPLWELVYMFSAKQRLLKHWSTLNAR